MCVVVVQLQLWDTAGQERFRAIVAAYYRGAHAVVMVYDVRVPETFDSLRGWLADIRHYAAENILLFVIGNKHDSTDSSSFTAVSSETAKAWCDSIGATHLLASAKTGLNVDASFHEVMLQFLDRPDMCTVKDTKSRPVSQSTAISIASKIEQSSSCAC
jgi:small GTP-binding protein